MQIYDISYVFIIQFLDKQFPIGLEERTLWKGSKSSCWWNIKNIICHNLLWEPAVRWLHAFWLPLTLQDSEYVFVFFFLLLPQLEAKHCHLTKSNIHENSEDNWLQFWFCSLVGGLSLLKSSDDSWYAMHFNSDEYPKRGMFACMVLLQSWVRKQQQAYQKSIEV